MCLYIKYMNIINNIKYVFIHKNMCVYMNIINNIKYMFIHKNMCVCVYI